MTTRTDHAFIDWIPPDSRFPPPGYDDLLESGRATGRKRIAHLRIEAGATGTLPERLEDFWAGLSPAAEDAGNLPLTRRARHEARIDARRDRAEDAAVEFLEGWFRRVPGTAAPVICVATEPAGFCAVVIAHDGPAPRDPASPLAPEQVATVAAVVMHLLRRTSGRPSAQEADIAVAAGHDSAFRIPTTHVAPVAVVPSRTDRQAAGRRVSNDKLPPLTPPEALAERLIAPGALCAGDRILPEEGERGDGPRTTAAAALADRYRRVLAQHIDHFETHRPDAARQDGRDGHPPRIEPESDRIRREIARTVTWWRRSAIVFVAIAALFMFLPDIWRAMRDALVALLPKGLGDWIPSATIPGVAAGDLALFSVVMAVLAGLQGLIVAEVGKCFERPDRPLARRFARYPRTCRWLAVLIWPTALAGIGAALLHWTPLAGVQPPALPGDAGIAHFRDTLAAIVWLLPVLGTWALVQASLSFTRTQEAAASSDHRYRLLDGLGVIAAQGGALARTARTAFRLDDPRLAPRFRPVAATLFDEGHWATQLARQRARLDTLRETARSSFQRRATNTTIIVAAIGLLGPLGRLAPGFNKPPPTLALVTERLGLKEIRSLPEFKALGQTAEPEEATAVSIEATDAETAAKTAARTCLAERVQDHRGDVWPSDDRVKAWAERCKIPLHDRWSEPEAPPEAPGVASQAAPPRVTLVQMFVTPPSGSDDGPAPDRQDKILAALHEIAANTGTNRQAPATLHEIAANTAKVLAALQGISADTAALTEIAEPMAALPAIAEHAAALPGIATNTTALAARIDDLHHREANLAAWFHLTGAMLYGLMDENRRLRLLGGSKPQQPISKIAYPEGCSEPLASVHFDTGGQDAARITGVRIGSDDVGLGIADLRTHLSDREGRLFVLGHADGRGSAVANFALSKARAQTVARLLELDDTRLAASPQGVGELGWILDGRPAGHDDDQARRVDLILCDATGAASTDLAEARGR